MNKELIKKYKAEFEHWLNGGNILVRFTTAKNPYKWYNIEEDFDAKSWNGHYGAQYIIDDEYVEFRKALAEGKTIQCNAKEGENDITYTAYGHTWWEDTTEFKYATTFYRIKPEEPKFKVGDWVILDFIKLTDTSDKYKNCAVQINGIKNGNYYYDKNCTSLISELPGNKGDWIITELWQPKLNDWCWFYDVPHYDMPVLQKFVTTIGDYYIALNDFNSKHTNLESVPSFEKGISDSYNRWKYCEPFLGTLPSTLRN